MTNKEANKKLDQYMYIMDATHPAKVIDFAVHPFALKYVQLQLKNTVRPVTTSEKQFISAMDNNFPSLVKSISNVLEAVLRQNNIDDIELLNKVGLPRYFDNVDKLNS